jgi:hypothetical protein
MPQTEPLERGARCSGTASVTPSRSRRSGLLRVAGLCVSAAIGVSACLPIATARAGDALTLDLLTERAKLAVSYISGAQLPSGLFQYQYDFLSGTFSRSNNDVRQAGAAFVMAEYAGVFDDAAVAKRAEAAVAALAGRSVPFGDGAVFTSSGVAEKSSTGSTALALLAELMYSSASGDNQFEKDRAAWLNALLKLQRPGGGFAQAPGRDVESDYFNGEAWLALAHYRRLFPDDSRVRDALAKADAYMIDHYGPDPNVQFMHWGLMAGTIRHATDGDPKELDFLAKVSEAYLTTLRPSVDPNSNACYSVEGLAAAATELSKAAVDADLVARIVARIEQELAKSFAMQVLPGQTRIEFATDRYLSAPDIGKFAGAFLDGRTRPQTRIDSTQHCLSAIIKYAAYKRLRGE